MAVLDNDLVNAIQVEPARRGLLPAKLDGGQSVLLTQTLDKLDALGLFGMVLGLREQLESKPVPKPELRRATRLAGRPRSRNP